MPEVTVRELRNPGGEVLDRVEAGARLTVTRSGRPVAELVPLRRPPATADTLLARWSSLPPVDPERLRADIDALLEPEL
jgi:prevent-host-death family protein